MTNFRSLGARLSAESTAVNNGDRFLMVSSRGKGELSVAEVSALLQEAYPEVAVAGETAGAAAAKRRSTRADTRLAREVQHPGHRICCLGIACNLLSAPSSELKAQK